MSTTAESEQSKQSHVTSITQPPRRPLNEILQEIGESLVENLKKNLKEKERKQKLDPTGNHEFD